LLTTALAIPALISLLRGSAKTTSSQRRMLLASVVTALFAFLMLSRVSFYAWNGITLLQKLQFPWRWMSVLSMLCTVLFSLSVPRLISRFKRFPRLVAYPALALVVTIILFDITQSVIPSAPIPVAEFSKIEKDLKTEPIWKGWWPTWAREGAFENTERVVAGNRRVDISGWDRESKEFVVHPGERLNVGVQLFYYPLWKATVNGQAVEIGKDENGAMTIPISGEASRVRLYFEEPLVNNAAYVVSGFTWLAPLFLLGFVYCRKYLQLLGSKPVLQKEYDFS